MYPMVASSPIQEPPVKTRPQIDIDVLTSIDSSMLEDSYVYVHCHYNNEGDDTLIRIWRSTFLIDKNSGSRAALVHAENISFAPVWTWIPASRAFTFLLVFKALPKGCTQFDLLEDIPQAGGFFIGDIQRNEQDVYHIHL
jgi:hypothetical protein